MDVRTFGDTFAVEQVSSRRISGPVGDQADTWPGPAAPLGWLATLAVAGMVVGGALGAMVGATTDDTVTMSTTVSVVPDAQALQGPLQTLVPGTDNEDFVAAELAWLSSQVSEQEDAAPDSSASLSVNQVGTADVVQLSASAPTAAQAEATVNQLLNSYVTRRQTAAGLAVQTELQAVEERLASLGTPGTADSPLAQETERLLGEQSALQAAALRVPSVVPVLRPPALVDPDGAPAPLLYGILGAVVGAVLSLAAGAIWRAASSRVFDARVLVSAGVPVLLPRVAAGRVRARKSRLPGVAPTSGDLTAAQLLLPQVLDKDAGPSSVLVLGSDARSAAAPVAWQLAWALAGGGTPVTLVTLDGGDVLRQPPTLPASLRVVSAEVDELDVLLPLGRAEGRHLIVHAPSLSAELALAGVTRHADYAVVVAGEGVSTLERVLAAVRDIDATSTTTLAGVVVTTKGRSRGATAVSTRGDEPARHAGPRQRALSPSEV